MTINVLTSAEYRALAKKQPRIRSRRTVVDSESFQSEREAKRWSELKLEARAHRIRHLRRQVVFPIVINGELITRYICDFEYIRGGRHIVEDVKARVKTKREERATRTEVYRLKKRLMFAVYGIVITEV